LQSLENIYKIKEKNKQAGSKAIKNKKEKEINTINLFA